MKKNVAAFAILAVVSNAYAFNESDAAKLVKSDSQTVACQLEDTQYEAVKVSGKPGETEEWADKYVVLWNGDFGCAGGNGTVVPNLTVVEIHGFSTPVVLPDYKTPELPLVEIDKFSGKDGSITIGGVGYGDKDQQHAPTKRFSFTLKLGKNGFIKQ